MPRVAFSLAALTAALALVLPASSVPAAGATWRTHHVDRLGASLALPRTWNDVTRMTPALRRVLRRLERESPALAPYLRALRPGGAVVFIAVDLRSRRFLTNLNVVRQKAPALSRSGLRRELVRQLRRSGNVRGPISTRTVQTRAGPALELRYVFRAAFAGLAVTGAATQYLLVRKGTLYVLTYSASPPERARYRRVFERSARSLRFAR